MSMAGFGQLPLWFWAVWTAHLAAYWLPSFAGGALSDSSSGFACARFVLEGWGEVAKAVLGGGESDPQETLSYFILGWFNVTNLFAVIAPALLGFTRRPRWAWAVALVCATGFVHAFGFWMGALTGEGIQPVKVGFFVWWLSYGGLALAGMTEAQRRVKANYAAGPSGGRARPTESAGSPESGVAAGGPSGKSNPVN